MVAAAAGVGGSGVAGVAGVAGAAGHLVGAAAGFPVSLVEGSADTDAAVVQTPSHSQEPLRSFSPPPETWSTWSIILISCSPPFQEFWSSQNS